MDSYKTHIENVENEIEIEIFFDYQPYERMTKHYPGCSESVDICEVLIANTNIEICLLKEIADLMEEEILEDRTEENSYNEYGYLLDDERI